MCIFRATVSAVSCLVVPAFICIDLPISLVLKINDDDDDDVCRLLPITLSVGQTAEKVKIWRKDCPPSFSLPFLIDGERHRQKMTDMLSFLCIISSSKQ